jgi:hypothetical protein
MPRLLFKDNVSVTFSVYNNHILDLVTKVMFDFGLDCVVTGGLEGTHGLYSAHYRGMALDFRSQHIPSPKRGLVYDTLCTQFGCDHTGKGTTYDVLWEAIGKPNEHFHIEVNCIVKDWPNGK